MNGAKINPETLKGMETEDKINGLIDMVYNIQCQPKLCQSQFVGKKHLWVMAALIIGILIGAEVLGIKDVLRFIK